MPRGHVGSLNMKYIDGGWNGRCTDGNILILNFENWQKGGGDSIDQPLDLVSPEVNLFYYFSLKRWNSMTSAKIAKIHDFPGMEKAFSKFHDFPGFSMTTGTLSIFF